MPADATVTQRRLVIYRTDHGPQAALYPVDANAFSRPEWVFPLAPAQPLPDQPPGGRVTIEGPLEAGASPSIRAGETDIVPARGLQRHSLDGDRIFAERGEVIAHPHAVGWDPSWRHVESPSTSPVRRWESRMRKAFWGAVLAWTFLLSWLAFAVWRAASGDPVRSGPMYVTGVGIGAVTASGMYAYRARRALRHARRRVDRPTHPMRMRVWWAAGGPEGPMAMAALFPPEADDTTPPVGHVPLVDVPPRLETAGLVDVKVRGAPEDAPIILHGDDELWPAQMSYEPRADASR